MTEVRDRAMHLPGALHMLGRKKTETHPMTEALCYAELHCHSYFSLLDGASSPEDLVGRAAELGLAALALTDHDSLGGAVRFWTAARRAGLHAVIGAEVTLADDTHLTLLAETQAGYAHLCKLITLARGETHPLDADASWPGKVSPALRWEHLAAHTGGLVALTGCRRGGVAGALLRDDPESAWRALARLRDLFGPDQLFVELQHHDLARDDWLVRHLLALARRAQLPVVATHNAHYATH